MGFNFAILQSLGKTDKDIERLHRSEIGAAKTEAPSLSNLPVRLSNPALLDGFISSESFLHSASNCCLEIKCFSI